MKICKECMKELVYYLDYEMKFDADAKDNFRKGSYHALHKLRLKLKVEGKC